MLLVSMHLLCTRRLDALRHVRLGRHCLHRHLPLCQGLSGDPCRSAAMMLTVHEQLELSRQLSAEVASGVAQEICKHIMFMRNQIPMLYEELRSSALDASSAATTGRRSGKQRKSDKFVTAADQLLSSLAPELFAAAPDTEITFLLGPSPMRAQEVYSMICSTAGVSASPSAEISSQQTPGNYIATASKTVLRKLILATAAGPEGPASKGATKLFVLIRRPADADLLPGFLPKRGLQIRIRKGLQVRISVKDAGQASKSIGRSMQRISESQVSEMSWSQAGSCCVGEACLGGDIKHQESLDPESRGQEQQVESEGEHIWYQSTVSLKGITQVSSQPMDVGGFM